MTEYLLERHLLSIGKDLQPVAFHEICGLDEIHLETSAGLRITVVTSGIERSSFLLGQCDAVALEDTCHIMDYQKDRI